MLNNYQAKILLNFFAIYFIWGMTYIWMKIATVEIHPFAVIFWQNILAAFLLIYFNRKKAVFTYFRTHYLQIITQSFFMLIFGVGLITISVDKLPASLASTIICSVPIWVSIINFAINRTITKRKILGILLGFTGIMLLSKTEVSFNNGSYLVLLLLAALSWSIGIQRHQSLTKLNDPYLTSAGQMIFASFFYLILFVIFSDGKKFISTTPSVVLSVVSLATFGDAIAFSSMIWLLKHISPIKVSTYAYVNPIVSIIMAWFVLNEQLRPEQIQYSFLVIFSVYITVTERILGAKNESN